ncbi:MAG: cupin domain-containing protein [Oscillospiraceae bacterium]
MGLQNCGLNIDAARRELNPHGTSEFPCAGYLCRLSDLPTDAIIWHRHEELEIIYIQEGTMKLLIPGEEYHLVKGEIALINSDILHYAIGDPFCELHSAVFSHVLVSGGNTTAFYKNMSTRCWRFPASRSGARETGFGRRLSGCFFRAGNGCLRLRVYGQGAAFQYFAELLSGVRAPASHPKVRKKYGHRPH